RGAGRDGDLCTAVGLLIDTGEAARARGFTTQIQAMPPSAARSLLLGRLAALDGDEHAAHRWLNEAWVAGAPGLDTAAAAACELALLLLTRRRRTEAATWARRAAAVAVAAGGLRRACAHVVLASS